MTSTTSPPSSLSLSGTAERRDRQSGVTLTATRRLHTHVPALAGLVLATILYFWPILQHFDTRMLSGGYDSSAVIWGWRNMWASLAQGRSPFTTKAVFFPVGANLAFATFTPFVALLLWPINAVLGIGGTVNAMELTSAFLAAVATYFLALRAGATCLPAFVAGLAYGFFPYRFVHAPYHYNLIQTEFLPLGALAFLRLVERPTRSRGLVLGVVVAAAYLTDLYIFSFLVGTLAVLAYCRRSEIDVRRTIRPLVWASGAGLVTASPVLVAQAVAAMHGSLQALPGWGGADAYSADLLSWFVPPPAHPLWGGSRPVWAGTGETYVGITVLLLAVIGACLVQRHRRRGWLALAVTSAVFAMGPFLHLAGRTGSLFTLRGRSFALPLPWAFISYLPVLNGLRAPERAVVVTELALAVLMALGLTELGRRWPRWAALVALGAGVLVVLEFLPGTFATLPVALPGPYKAIAAQHDKRVILEIPIQWTGGTSIVGETTHDEQLYFYYDSFTGHPVVNGSVARYPDPKVRTLRRIPVYAQVASLAGAWGFTERATFGVADLQAIGIGYIVYFRDRPEPAVYHYVQRLGLPVLADDGNIIVWRVPAPVGPQP